jgi:hypothetical protein
MGTQKQGRAQILTSVGWVFDSSKTRRVKSRLFKNKEIKEPRVSGFLFIYKLENHLGWVFKILFFQGMDKECVFHCFLR